MGKVRQAENFFSFRFFNCMWMCALRFRGSNDKATMRMPRPGGLRGAFAGNSFDVKGETDDSN